MAVKPVTKMTVTLLNETALARLYADGGDRQQWVPRRVCPSVLKLPTLGGQPPRHIVEIEDWWLEQHPFVALPPTRQQGELL